ncbi:phage antirepressor protein [Patescibacteria group bacterium]|nr:phage antirepressor protein [Patescibacteria group bacterium]
MSKKPQSIAIFNQKKIRRHWDEKKELWYFSIVDVIEILTNSSIPKRYWSDLKSNLEKEGSEVYEKIVRFKMVAADGKQRETDCFSTKNLFRVIQSIPSKRAEPFKLWLAKVGKERLDEIENPELAQERMKKLYEQKGYPKDWINKRLRGIAIRQNLTDEWQDRGIQRQKDYAILTAEISKATFGMTPNEYKKFKNIPKKSRASLRDNMTDFELIFTMLGEKVTTEISKKEQPKNMSANKKVSRRGGGVAGKARKETEKEIGRSVISNDNFLNTGNQAKQLK